MMNDTQYGLMVDKLAEEIINDAIMEKMAAEEEESVPAPAAAEEEDEAILAMNSIMKSFKINK